MPNYFTKGFTYIPQYNGDTGYFEDFEEADSQTFVAGDFVLLNGAGQVTVASGEVAEDILGIAQEDATNVTSNNAMINVHVIRPGDLFAVRLIAAETFSRTVVGLPAELVDVAPGAWRVQHGTTTNGYCKIIASLEGTRGEGPFTAGGPVKVAFLPRDLAGSNGLQFHDPASD
jgi:hypothetical protein